MNSDTEFMWLLLFIIIICNKIRTMYGRVIIRHFGRIGGIFRNFGNLMVL